MNTRVYKLAYTDKAEAIQDLKSKGILIEVEEQDVYSPQTHAVVHLGNIPLEPAQYDEQGNETQPAIISGKYHVDVMSEDLTLDFGDKEQQVEEGSEYHTF